VFFLLSGVIRCPGFLALFGVLAFGALTCAGLLYLTPEVETNFDLIQESDSEAAIVHSAFSAVIDSRSHGQGRISGGHSVNGVFEVFIIYELLEPDISGGMLNTQVLRSIADFEQQMRSLPEWRRFCDWATEHHRALCDPGLSFLSYALPTPSRVAGDVVPKSLTPDGQSRDPIPLPTILHMIEQRKLTDLLLPDGFDPEVHSTPTSLRSAFRFTMPGALASETPAQTRERLDRVKSEWDTFVAKALLPYLEESFQDDAGIIRIYFDGTHFGQLETRELLDRDSILMAGALVVVLLYLLFHTRSIPLSGMGVAVIVLSKDLANVVFAYLVGARVSNVVQFLCTFLTVGIGTNILFVFSDSWWDSAQYVDGDVARLAWTYQHAGKVTLAMTVTAALVFFANLASVLRPLREFGLFMGFCCLIFWVLASLVYVPLCLANEQSCSRCALRARCDKDDSHKPGGRRLPARVFERATRSAYTWRCSLCIVPVLCAVAFSYLALWKLNVNRELPRFFPDNHNQYTGQDAFSQFTLANDAFGLSVLPPPRTEEVCSEEHFRAQDKERCAFFWCSVQQDVISPGGNNSCTCFRRKQNGCEANTQGLAVHRFAGLVDAEEEQLQLALNNYINPIGNVASSFTHDKMPPVLLQQWETGKTMFAPMTQVTTTFERHNLTECGWEELCFCGTYMCQLPSPEWVRVPQMLRLQASSARRLQGAVEQVHWNELATVNVVLGLKVDKGSPLIGRRDLDSSWSFLGTFDATPPQAQRDMYRLCSELAEDLLVAERRCWMLDFRQFLFDRQELFPVPAHKFNILLAEFVRTGTTGRGRSEQYLWFDGNTLKASYASFTVNIHKNANPKIALAFKTKWDSYLNTFNERASDYMQGALHTSTLWVKAEAQESLLSSTVVTLAIIVVVSLAATFFFTRNHLLPIYSVCVVIGAIGGVAFFMINVMSWSIGPIEVIGLISFCGYALSCALQVSCRYSCRLAAMDPHPALRHHDEKLAERLQRVTFALKSVGGAMIGSCISMVGCSVFLIFCRLTIFSRVGSAVAIFTLLSVFAAIVPLSGCLLMCGPLPPTSRKDASDPMSCLHRCLTCNRGAKSQGRTERSVKNTGPSAQYEAEHVTESSVPQTAVAAPGQL